MHIRTFRAANLNSALTMIRQQMGPDAAVLHTRQVNGGLLGRLRGQSIEVTAGLKHHNDVRTGPARDQTAGEGENRTPIDAPRRQPPHGRLHHDLQRSGWPTDVIDAWQSQRVVSFATSPETTESLLQQFGDWASRQIRIVSPIDLRHAGPRVVALVGATGVGKTTTIAKLAGQFRLDHSARVGLLTVDSFRAAAVEQIQAFADALAAPLEVVRTIDQVPEALGRLADVDLILVDTVGQSPRDQQPLAELSRLLAAIGPHETHLVIDANNSLTAAEDTLRAFAVCDPTAMVLSKVDEVRSAAPTLAVALACPLGFSYLTTGQSVPHDIRPATRESVSELASGLAVTGIDSVISTRPEAA
jgi:flagellar biosynthesis protein FlhF